MSYGLPECSITSEDDHEAAILHVEGELVGTTTDVLEGAVNVCLRRAPRTVTVDLARVHFMDSAGISTLLRCRGRATAQRARFTVIRPSALVTRLMRPEIRALLAISPATDPVPRAADSPHPAARGPVRPLRCLACGTTTEHVPGPTTRGRDGEVLVQWWSCTECEEGNTVLG